MKIRDLIEALKLADPAAHVEFAGKVEKSYGTYLDIHTDLEEQPVLKLNTPSLVRISVGYFDYDRK